MKMETSLNLFEKQLQIEMISNISINIIFNISIFELRSHCFIS